MDCAEIQCPRCVSVGNAAVDERSIAGEMIRVARMKASSQEIIHGDVKLNLAAFLHAEGFTASDIIEHISEVMEAL